MVMEVVIPVNGEKELPSAASSGYTSAVDTVASLPPSSRASSAASSDVENGNSKPRLRKRNGGPLIVVSEDDSELEFLEPKAKSAKSKGKFKKAAKKAESSDYEVSGSAAESDAPSADEDEEDTQSFVDVSDNDQPKRKVKPKKPSKPARKAPSKKRKSASSDVEMDLDDDVATVKGKARNERATQPPKTLPRSESCERIPTRGNLNHRPSERTGNRCGPPPLEMFHFERLVIDEYTYLNGKILSMVSKLTATRRWVLSGTPPIHDFASLKTIAAFLDIHLGVDDDGEGQSEQIKKRRRNRLVRTSIECKI